jgi:hypothetical protein
MRKINRVSRLEPIRAPIENIHHTTVIKHTKKKANKKEETMQAVMK